MINKTVKDYNLKTIRAIKKEMKGVGPTLVARSLNVSRQTIHWHLNERKAATANIEQLEAISKAISTIKNERLTKSLKLSRKIKAA